MLDIGRKDRKGDGNKAVSKKQLNLHEREGNTKSIDL